MHWNKLQAGEAVSWQAGGSEFRCVAGGTGGASHTHALQKKRIE